MVEVVFCDFVEWQGFGLCIVFCSVGIGDWYFGECVDYWMIDLLVCCGYDGSQYCVWQFMVLLFVENDFVVVFDWMYECIFCEWVCDEDEEGKVMFLFVFDLNVFFYDVFDLYYVGVDMFDLVFGMIEMVICGLFCQFEFVLCQFCMFWIFGVLLGGFF